MHHRRIYTQFLAYTIKLIEVGRIVRLEERDKFSKHFFVSISYGLRDAIDHRDS